MNAKTGSRDQRRAPRKSPGHSVTVTNIITGQPLGHLGNLSSNGMLLIGPFAPRGEAVYQVSLPLPHPDGSVPAIEVGIQEQWQAAAASPGQLWAGYRIIAIGPAQASLLERWLKQG